MTIHILNLLTHTIKVCTCKIHNPIPIIKRNPFLGRIQIDQTLP